MRYENGADRRPRRREYGRTEHDRTWENDRNAGTRPGSGAVGRHSPHIDAGSPLPALIYGRWPVLEALRTGQVTALYMVEDLHGEARAEIEEAAQQQSIRIQYVTRTELEYELPGVNHQGIAAECAPYSYMTLSDMMASTPAQPREPAGLTPLLVAVDNVQDPQNLGALLRTAEGAGVQGVILPRHRAAEITPAVVRASAGAALHLHVAQVTNLVRSLKDLQAAGYWAAGLDMEGSVPYYELDADRPLVLVVGSEGQGLSRLVRQTCDYVVSLPMHGHIASLNAATAGAIVLYDIRRKQASMKESTESGSHA